MSYPTPVLFLIFNRPEHTRRVFEAIREIKPAYLYISADGPRPGHPTDAERCGQTRSIIREIDWPCEVKTLLRDENLGCKRAVQGGIDWFFQQVEAGVILEDDCLPNASFFYFCTSMLDQYRDDETVMHIAGNNPAPEACRQLVSTYLYSRFPFIWGWASWRRAWKKYDDRYTGLKQAWLDPQSSFNTLIPDKAARRYLLDKFIQTRDGAMDTWDYPWFYTILQCQGLCVTPVQSLVENIGFDQAGTHTKASVFNRKRPIDLMTIGEIVHPTGKVPDPAIEKAFFYASQKKAPGLFLRRIAPFLFYKTSTPV